MAELIINIKSNPLSYPIFIEDSQITDLKGQILSQCRGEKHLVVISEKVYKLYNKVLGFKKENLIILKDGEKEKNLKTYTKILNTALKKGLTRKDTLIAIGGGVCGDITGFVAATYMRGIDFIQIPTTLLACVDSSVGGKTGINTNFGKNLVGSFYQPKAVIINTNFLQTLDERQFKTGLGEIVKYAFIEKSCQTNSDFQLINFLTEKKDKILAKDNSTLSELVKICINLKASVVEKDEKENALRRILNFGHTYGHAIEKITNYKKFTHGEAIVEGMNFAFNLAFKMELVDKSYKFLAEDIINKFDFKKVGTFPIEKMVKLMQMDKKANSKEIVFILPCGYGEVKAVEIFPEKLKEDMV